MFSPIPVARTPQSLTPDPFNAFQQASPIVPFTTPLFPHVDVLDAIVRREAPTVLRPRSFFIAWSGVLVLSFEGFSSTLLRIKSNIDKALPHLPSENPGSRWPKITLAALQDGKALTADDIRVLADVCHEWDEHLRKEAEPLLVEELMALVFGNRSTGVRLFTHRIPLLGNHSTTGDDAPPAHHITQVQEIVAPLKGEDLTDYIPDVQRVGHRANHYREPWRETTLMVDASRLDVGYIRGFKAAVDACLPGYYHWFPAASRHITVRRL